MEDKFRAGRRSPACILPVYAWEKEFVLPHYLYDPKSLKSKPKKASFLYQRVKDYLDNTSLHGFKYITKDGNNFIERLLWIICCVLALAGTVYFLYPVFQRSFNSPIITTVESTSVPIWYVPFPAVTICNVNKGVKSIIAKLAEENREWKRYKNTTIFKLVEILARPELVMEVNEYASDTRKLKALMSNKKDHLDELMELVQQPINRMALKCWWMGKEQNCSTLFETRRTESGFCWSFNSKGMKELISENSLFSSSSLESYEYEIVTEAPKATTTMSSASDDSVYHDSTEDNLTNTEAPGNNPNSQQGKTSELRRINGSGAHMGLTVLLNPELEEYYAASEDFSGFQVLVHHPSDFPNVDTKGFVVSPGKEVFVATTATNTYSTEDVRSLQKSKRDCFFGDDKKLAFYSSYTYANCLLECRILSMNKTCDCVPYMYSLLDKIPACTYKQLQCFVRNKQKFQTLTPKGKVEGLDPKVKSMKCTCRPGCKETSYVTEVSSAQFPRDAANYPLTKGMEDVQAENLILLRVFFKDLYFIRYRRDIVYKWNDLVAAFGGIVGLFVGFSLLSGVEILYFFTVRVFLKWHEE